MSDQGKHIKAIVFDMDGLMVDSEPLARRAWAKVLGSYDVELDDLTYARMVGLRLEECARLVQERYDLPLGVDKLAHLKEVYLAEIRAEGVPTMPGLEHLIEKITQRAIPWAVATSSRLAEAQAVMEHLRLSDAYWAIAGGDEVDHGKPAPDVYLLAATRLGYRPEQCLALEDSVPGAQAARAAGMTTIAVPNGFTRAIDFPFVDYVYDSLAGVAEDLDELLR